MEKGNMNGQRIRSIFGGEIENRRKSVLKGEGKRDSDFVRKGKRTKGGQFQKKGNLNGRKIRLIFGRGIKNRRKLILKGEEKRYSNFVRKGKKNRSGSISKGEGKSKWPKVTRSFR